MFILFDVLFILLFGLCVYYFFKTRHQTLLKNMLKESADVISIIEGDGSKILNIYGCGYENIAGKDWRDYTKESSVVKIEEALLKAKYNPDNAVEIDLVETKAGKSFYAKITYSSKLVKYVCNWVDITEAEMLKNALHVSRNEYDLLMDLIPAGIFRISKKCNITSCNEEFKRITGVEDSESFFEAIVKDDLDLVKEAWCKNIIAGASCYGEFRILRGGEVRWISYSLKPVWERNALFDYIGVLQDVTLRKYSEFELLENKQKLEKGVSMVAELIRNNAYRSGACPKN